MTSHILFLPSSSREHGNSETLATLAAKSFVGSSTPWLRLSNDPLPPFEFCVACFGARWVGSLLGRANKPGEVLNDKGALEVARNFFAQDGER